jgi:hypothetical protein
MPGASPDTKKWQRWSSNVARGNPHCDRGIGLVAHQRGWFDKWRCCSKECRDTFAAKRPKMSQQEWSAVT